LYGGLTVLPVIINKAFITTVAVAVSHLLLYMQVKKTTDKNYVKGISNRFVTTILLIVFTLLFYVGGALEINYQFNLYLPETDIKFVYLQLYTLCFALVLLLIFKRYSVAVTTVRNLILAICFGFHLLYIPFINKASQTMLQQGRSLLFSSHWLSDVVFIAIAISAINYVRKNSIALNKTLPKFSSIITIAVLIFISVEVGQIYMWLRSDGTTISIQKSTAAYFKAGITITWATSSFILMWLGMKHHYKTLRILSLSLFTLALLKLFLWDIRNIGEGGKIAAFIMLGVLLLIISFMYQRLKKLFTNDIAVDE
jgi:uncharacterized membrane protein